MNADYGFFELQSKLLEIAVKIDEICNKYHINYFLVGGSALGAVRHKGFIPWDDDFDIGMLEKDYRKFQEIAPKEFEGTELFLQTIDSEKEYNLPFIKVRDSSTTNMSRQHMKRKINHGVWIDIFMYETLPREKWKQTLYKKISAMIYICWNEDYSCGRLKSQIVKTGESIKGKKNLIKSLVNFAHQLGANEEKEYMTTIAFPVKVPYSVLENTIRVAFEEKHFPIAKDYDTYLKCIFGPHYMQEPTEEEKQAKIHRPEILDLNTSYLEYIKHD